MRGQEVPPNSANEPGPAVGDFGDLVDWGADFLEEDVEDFTGVEGAEHLTRFGEVLGASS